MNHLSSDLRKMNTQLKTLMRKMNTLATLIEEKKPQEEASLPAPTKQSDEDNFRISEETQVVLDIISSSQNGIHITLLRQETGYADKKISNIVQRASQKGLIKRVKRGVYKAA